MYFQGFQMCLHMTNAILSVDEIVALKRLKMEKEKEGFPITSLREINTILKAQHPNIVTVRVRGREKCLVIDVCVVCCVSL